MLSFLIKKRKCLYRNIPVIKFCYTRKRERKNERGRKREREKEIREKEQSVKRRAVVIKIKTRTQFKNHVYFLREIEIFE